jgi:hypothetical protein
MIEVSNMKKTVLIVLIVFLGAAAVGCSKKKSSNPEQTVLDPIDLLPKAGEISGWSPQGDAEEWVGDALYQPINGEAEIYMRYGFQEAAFQDYQGSGSWANTVLSVRVFEQESAAQAKALYEDPGSGTGAPWTGGDAAGDQARTEQFALSCTVEFYEQQYFVHINIASGDDQALDMVKLFARNVSEKID